MGIAKITLFSFCFLALWFLPIITQAHEEVESAVIHMTSDGFSPKKVIVNIGESVIFENVDNEDHWPASNDHPSHTLYDGSSLDQHCSPDSNDNSFDACAPVEPGSSWEFTFSKEGMFLFHDHLWPQFQGSVEVVGVKDLVGVSIWQKIVNILKNLFNRILIVLHLQKPEDVSLKTGQTKNNLYEGLKGKYQTIVAESGPSKAIAELRDESANNSDVLSFCHDLLHDIGRASYDKYKNFDDSAKYQTDYCNSGYIHGVFESYFIDKGNDLEGVSKLCEDYSKGKDFDMWQCMHGVGHGLMYLTGGDLNRSLGLCNDVFGKDISQTCQNGVFMEIFNSEVLAKEIEFVDPADPFATCRSATFDKQDCYVYLPTFLSQTLSEDFNQMFFECDKVEQDYKAYCVGGVASEAMKRNMDEPEKVKELCDNLDREENRQACVMGAISIYVFQKASYDDGVKLCNSAFLGYKALCLNKISEVKDWF